MAAIAAIAGAGLFAFALSDADHAAWPGLLAGAAIATLSYLVWRDVAVAAGARAGQGVTVAVLVAFAAAVLAVGSLLVWPVGLVALAATAWLALGRRRRAARKHEGLRTLR